MQEQLNKADQVATLATTVTVEQVFVGIDVEGRTSLLVQRAQADKLLPRAGTTRPPVVALQILQQRDALFEPLQIVGHSASLPPRVEHRSKATIFPGKDGGRRWFLKPQRPEPGEKGEYGVPAQHQRIMNEDLGSVEPRAYGKHRPPQTRKRRLRRVQTPEPSAQRGGIGHAIRIFDHGRRRFPTTALYEIAA